MGTNDVLLTAEKRIQEYERVNGQIQAEIQALGLAVDLLKTELQTMQQFTTQHILGLHEARVRDQATVKFALQRLHESHNLTAEQEALINKKIDELLLILVDSKTTEDTRLEQVFDQFLDIPSSSQESLKRPNEDPGSENEPSKRARISK